MSTNDRQFAVPQKEADKLKNNADMAGAVFLLAIFAGVALIVGVALYWTEIQGKELPMRVNVDVAETTEPQTR